MGIVLNRVTVVPSTYAFPIHTIFVDRHDKLWCQDHKIAFVGGKQEGYKLQ